MDMVNIDQNQKQDNESVETQIFLDILSMVLFAGKERNETGWAKIVTDASFYHYKITPLGPSHGERCSELLRSKTQLWSQTFNFINSASLKCAIQLGIPDVIHNHGEPMTLSELAAALPINQSKANCIYRLMRVLVHSGLFVEQKVGENEAYCLTPMSRLLLKDEPLNARAFVAFQLDPIMIRPWHFLSDWFQNDDTNAFETAHGRSFWDYCTHEPRISDSFNEAMASDSQLMTYVLIEKCKDMFGGLTSLTDVGGGTGTMARAIAKAFPRLKCIVFDLPHVVADLQGSEHLEFVGGDMFETIPPANAILLKWIMHDWSDEDCVRILKRCKEAIPSKDEGGKLIIMDTVIDQNQKQDNETVEAQIFIDLVMMVVVSGKDRNETEWAKIFSVAGFGHYKITPTGLMSVIEVYPQ